MGNTRIQEASDDTILPFDILEASPVTMQPGIRVFAWRTWTLTLTAGFLAASDTPAPDSVALAGSLQEELGCP